VDGKQSMWKLVQSSWYSVNKQVSSESGHPFAHLVTSRNKLLYPGLIQGAHLNSCSVRQARKALFQIKYFQLSVEWILIIRKKDWRCYPQMFR